MTRVGNRETEGCRWDICMFMPVNMLLVLYSTLGIVAPGPDLLQSRIIKNARLSRFVPISMIGRILFFFFFAFAFLCE